MDVLTTIVSSTEDLSSIGTTDVDNNASSASLSTHQMDHVDFNTHNEQYERQVEELTKQLDESKSAEKRANDEREKYIQLYNRINERFLSFERKQLDQLRRILTILTPDDHKLLSDGQNDYRRPRRAFTSPSTSILLPSSLNQPLEDSNSSATIDYHKSETDWNSLLAQISEIMEFSEKFTAKYSEQTEENNKLRLLINQKQDKNVKLLIDLSLMKAKHEEERQMHVQFEKQYNEANHVIEKDQLKRQQKLRNYALLADDEGEILLSSLMKKADKNETDFLEMKIQYENVLTEQINEIKKLVKERELLHVYIQRLEAENASLSAITNDDETVKLLTYSSQSPTTYEEAWKLIVQLREQILEQMKIREKLRNDIQQLDYSHKTDIREREQIEELLNRDLTAAKDQILILESVRSEYNHVLNKNKELERDLEIYANEVIKTKTVANSLTTQLKEKIEELSREKDKINEDNAGFRIQIQKLKVDFENSESVQHDFVKLSQALQVQLEEFRNSENELRWQPEEDFSECQRCHSQFGVTLRKHHCRHCGKVLCKECTNKTVHTGPHRRPSRVCDVCYTLLVKSSQPYFLAGVPKV